MSTRVNIKSGLKIKAINNVFSSQIFWVAAFSVLTAFAAQVSVPVQPVPFTLQTMFVFLSGAFLGSRNGAYSQIVYLILGIIGLPVFADMSFGFAKLLGPTGGYLLAFPFGAYLTGYIIEKKKSLPIVFMAMLLASFVILLVGASYLSLFYDRAFVAGALIFTPWDLIKVSAAASIYYSISKKYSKLP